MRSLFVVTDEPFVNPYLNMVQKVEEVCRKSGVECVCVDGSCTVPPLQVLKRKRSTKAGGQVAKTRHASRPISFVAPGTYIALGEKKRRQAALAEESGYLSGYKDRRVITFVGMGGMASREGAGLYGSDEAGKVIDDRLPGQCDAPELEVEEYMVGGKKYRHSKELAEMSDSKKREFAVSAAIQAVESAMPYALEWWDAELLPGKLRKELAAKEGKAIASRAKKQASLPGGKV